MENTTTTNESKTFQPTIFEIVPECGTAEDFLIENIEPEEIEVLEFQTASPADVTDNQDRQP
jgi:hypothetical protein